VTLVDVDGETGQALGASGPGSISSKSFTSNSSTRSGEANAPKFDRCASPHSWASSPATGVGARSAAMIVAAPR
jgi:hypothetical protein